LTRIADTALAGSAVNITSAEEEAVDAIRGIVVEAVALGSFRG
jgi:hypothetical protein